MKKGDLRRQAILDTAEALFFQRGYEETSVQDILNAMGLSKGGFYHHFESKMSVLEAVSARRAEKKFTQAARELRASSLGALEKLNRLFALVNIFEREQPEFVQMVLNVCFRGGDAALLRAIREVTLAQLGPVMDEIVVQGVREGVFYTRQLGGIGRLLLMLAHDVEDEAARLLIAGEGKPESVVSVIDALNVYRDSVRVTDTLLTEPAFVDRRAPAGKHVYNVTAMYNNGLESSLSESASITTFVTAADADCVNVYADGNTLCVDNAADRTQVYDVTGICRYAGSEGNLRLRLPAGIYIVRTGGKTWKITM